MSKKWFPPNVAADLRAAAEDTLAGDGGAQLPSLTTDRLVHELRVHQIELEMQNEALRQAQQALEESRDRYVDLYEFAPVGYLTLTDSGLIAAINLTGAALLDCERSRLIQRRFAALIAPADGDRWYRHFLHALRHGDQASCEAEMLRDDGSRFFARLDLLRVLAAGEPPAVRVTLMDISERKRAETAQAAAEAQRQLALVEAERLAELKNNFLANMSHEIRTPLNGVLNLAVLGQRDSPPGSPAHATFSRIDEAGRHLLAVVNDILDFGRIEAGKLAIAPVAIELGPLIKRAAAFAAENARAKGLAFRLRQGADVPAGCLADPLRLTQILVNLLDNAVKFTRRGGVTLSLGREGGHLVFEVVDTGIGMSEEVVGRLFSAFSQADGSTTRRFGGSGLGLAISKRLAELMGGEIRVSSVVGSGSAFALRLPLTEVALPVPAPAPALTPALAPPGERPLAGMAILAAEDHAVNRLVLEELLSEQGAQLTCVENGLLAVEQVARSGAAAWDIVLMDVQMPVMDGYAAARHLRELAPALPIVGVTAHAMAAERDNCLAAGMVECVTKPYGRDGLVAAILRHARRRMSPASPPPASPPPTEEGVAR